MGESESKSSKISCSSSLLENRDTSKDYITKRIREIKSILPHLGLGYIETALVCYNYNVEETINNLLEENKKNLHPNLQRIDPKLPARKMESQQQYQNQRTTKEENESY